MMVATDEPDHQHQHQHQHQQQQHESATVNQLGTDNDGNDIHLSAIIPHSVPDPIEDSPYKSPTATIITTTTTLPHDECDDELWKTTSMKRLVPPPPPGTSLMETFRHKLRAFTVVMSTVPRDARGLVRYLKLLWMIRKARRTNTNIPKLFQENVRKHPDKVAFYFEDEKWTFAEVEEYSNRVANYFKGRGVKHSDAVALFMENRIQYICIWLGLAKLGAVPALINYNLRLVPLAHSITTADCKVIICGAELQQAVKDIQNDLPDLPVYVSGCNDSAPGISGAENLDVALRTSDTSVPIEIDSVNFSDKMVYIYTSGTTGLPKAAVIKHSRFLMFCGGVNFLPALKREDIIYDPLPVYHTAGGMLGVGQVLVFGLSTVLRVKFSATQYWRDAIHYKATAGQYIGEICRYLLNTPPKPEDTQHKIRIMFGNGLRPQIWEQFQERFNIPTISEFYGSTEGNANIINIDGKPGAVGFLSVIFPWVYPCMLVMVDEETGQPIRDKNGVCIRCKPGEPGELVGKIVRNDPVRDFHGYADKKATQKKIGNDVFKKGDTAFFSGDILVMDERGYLYFKDRTGDTFRWRGENVSTSEVEGVVSKSAALTDVVVYGVEVPGSEGRAGMAAILDPEGKLSMSELGSGVIRTLPAYARPLFVRIVTKLDMTGTYKLKKLDLQKEGFNIEKLNDKIYYLDAKKETYIPLNNELYASIISGTARL